MNEFKFCTNCGTKLPGDQKFCQTCGADVQNITPISVPEFTSAQAPQYAAPQQAQAPQYAAPQQAQAPQYAAPQQAQAPQYAAPQQAQVPQYAVPQQAQAPQYAAPQQAQAPQYAAPQQAQAPQYAAPQQVQAPQYAAPQQAQANQYSGSQAQANQYSGSQAQANQYSGFQAQANQYSGPQAQANQYSAGPQQAYNYQYTSSQQAQEPQKPKRANSPSKDRILKIVGNSFMLVLALVMLLSAFLPLMSLKLEIPGIEKSVTVNFNAIDSIQMFFATFGSLDDEEVQDKMEEIYEDDDYQEYEEYWEEGRKLDKIGPYIKKFININLSHEDSTTTVAVATMGVLSIAQIVLTAIFIFVAATHFMSSLRGLAKPISSTPFILFGISALMMFLNTFSMKYVFDLLNGNFYFAEMKSSVADWVLTSQIIIIVALISLLVVKLIEAPYHITKREIIKRSLSIAFAIVLLVSLSAPVIKTEIKSEFYDTDRKTTIETNLDSAIFSSFVVNDSAKEDLAEWSSEDFEAGAQSIFDNLSYLEKRDLKKPTAEGKSANMSLLSYLLLGAGAYKYSLLFEIGSLLLVAIAACALLIIMQHVYELVSRSKSAYATTTLSKTFAIILALAVLGLLIVITTIVNHNADTASIEYSTSLAYGPILMAVAAIALACVPPVYGFEMEKKKF